MVARLFLVLVALSIALGTGEVLVRWLPATALGYDIRGERFVPPAEYERREGRNSLGTYDREPGVRAPGRSRILLVGDSYVESISMAPGETLPSRVAAHLETARPGAFEVISLSKSGWGQREQLQALRRFGAQLKPDHVVLVFTPRNDPMNNAKDLPGLDQNLRERAAMLRTGKPSSRVFRQDQAVGLWFPDSALNQLVSHRLTVARLRPADPVPLMFLAFSPDREEMWAETWGETRELLHRLRAQSEKLGATFEVMSVSTPEGVMPEAQGAARLRASHPSFSALRFDVDLPDRRLSKICAELAVPFYALQPPLRTLEQQVGPLHWRYDGHWNQVGNDKAGALIARRIIEGDASR